MRGAMGAPEENEMGWMVGWESKDELVQHLLRQQGGNCDVVKHSLVGNNLWMLMQRKVDGLKFVLLCKLAFHRGSGGGDRDAWGYKDIDESCGPCEVNCPLYLINEASPVPEGLKYAAEWRESVRAYHANKRIGPKFVRGLKVGDKFQYGDKVVEFAGWMKRGRRQILCGNWNGKLYRWSVANVRPLAEGGAQ